MPEQIFDEEKTDFYDKKEREQGITTERQYYEEAAAEVAPHPGVMKQSGLLAPEQERPLQEERRVELEDENGHAHAHASTGVGWVALALSLISLFVFPVLLGAAGIITGFVARRRGAMKLGAWAIGLGIVSLAVSILVVPFF